MSSCVFHAPFIQQHAGFEFYAVLERTKNQAEKKYPRVITFRNLDGLLADDKIELVVVNTPNILHFEYAKKCLQAGKHVIVEKPFTVTVNESEYLAALAKEKKCYLSVFQNRRWDSDYLTVKEVIESGQLGAIMEAEIHFDRYNKSLSPKGHKEVPVKGTGIIYDLGAHIIDQALQLFGLPQEVFADKLKQRTSSLVDDYMEILLLYPAMRVRLKGSTIVREPVPSFVIHGSKGSFLKNRGDVQEVDLQKGKIPGSPGWGREDEKDAGLLHTESGGKIIKERVPSLTGNYMAFYEGIYDSLRNQGKLPVTADEGTDVIRIIEAAYTSIADRKIVSLFT